MFRSKTLFILGAGASNEANLPTGDLLKDQIADKIDIRFDIFGDKQEYGDRQIWLAFQQIAKGQSVNINQLLSKSQQIKDALPQAISIDNLLDAHRDDKVAEICGKLGIVKCIQAAEEDSKLFLVV